MIDFDKAIELIRRNGGFKPNNNDSSYYRVYRVSGSKPMQVRVSNHGTHLKTWYDKDYDPSYAINTCVVYSEDGMHDSNVTVDMRKTNEQGAVIGEKKMFEVIQYVYNCQLLNDNDAALINQAILSTWQNKSFKDPFAGTPKHAKVYKLKPNEPIETLVENKIHNENKIMNKKQVIRLTESQFHQIVAESVKKILKETNQDYSDYTEEDKIRDYVYSLDADEAFDYIIKNSQTGLEIELDCGIHFGMGLYAWKDEAEKFLPKDMLSPMRNDLFVSLEKPNVLKTYIKNAFRKNGTLAAY